ncbi:acyl-CoA dehydrogenase family protein [Mycobacterium sp. 236(2023)]|uniref:acyl-CoA dehydrogenase family protein n=1 Tax=Mycobacterium sp. 236(2023) TaxID=3038163 RepID=UPI0024158DB3|nr:acyl-CoA dehydrogenase family protein [Mycobacterium sp. 236(2023)]MDG4668073.1 acyl-CoA dehydrogenase family protein [Mycobacterium sp. 236(2023)]
MDEVLAFTTTDAERAFALSAIEFLSSHRDRRIARNLAWGKGPEHLTLFHESSDAEERAEADEAMAWQRDRWRAGFGWITGPHEFGGRGLPQSFDRLYRQVESLFDVPDPSPLRIGIGTVGPALVAAGQPEQIQRWAVPIYRGELIACQLFSEPAAGSDLAGVRSRAVADGDGWRLNGQKVWTSNAQIADFGLALARTDPSAAKHAGLTMFVVPMDAAGVVIRPLRQMTGGASFTEVFLDDVVVTAEAVVGAVGSGWKVATGALAGERKAVGDRTHEITDRAVGMLRELAVREGAMSDPHVRQHFSQVYSTLRIARFQQQRVQAIPDAQLSGAERAIDKLMVSSNLRAIGEVAAEVLGPKLAADTGEWGTFGWNKWIMGAMGYRIAGGTEEILKTMLAERVLSLPREPR